MSQPAARQMPHWPRLMGADLAALYLGIGKTTLSQKGPAPKSNGRRKLYDIQDLDRWADALDGQPLDESQKKDEGTDMLARVRERIAGGPD